MSETTIATGIYTIENVDRHNDVVLADDKSGTLVAGSSAVDADPPLKARWMITRLRNRRYTISPAAKRNKYASWPSAIRLGSAIVTSPDANDWVVQETSKKETFVISHFQHQLYWGFEDAAQGSPVMLRDRPTGFGNRWRFCPCLGSTTVMPQHVNESRNGDGNLDCRSVTVPTPGQPRETDDGQPASSNRVIPQSVVESLAIDGSNVDSKMPTTPNRNQTKEVEALPAAVVSQDVVEFPKVEENLDIQTATIRTRNQTRDVDEGQLATSTPVIPQSVVELLAIDRSDVDFQTASSLSKTSEVDDSRPAIRRVLEGHTDDVNSVAYSPDGERIVSGSSDSTIRVWDVHTRRLALEPIEGHADSVRSVAFSAGGKRIMSGSYDKTVRIWDTHSGTLVSTINHTDWVTFVACSPDGKGIVFGYADRPVCMLDAKTGVLGPLLGKGVTSVNFSDDGKKLLSGSTDCMVRVWDADTGHTIRTFRGLSPVRSARFSPDSRRIVSGDSDGIVTVWDMQSSDSITLFGHEVEVRSVAFSPDGERIVSGGKDRQIIVWDANSGRALGRLSGHTDQVASVSFSPDGKWVVSGSWDNTVRIWEADRLDAMPESDAESDVTDTDSDADSDDA